MKNKNFLYHEWRIPTVGCLIFVLVLAINLTIGAWSVSEILSWFGKDIPKLFDMLIGAITGEATIPIAAVGYILKICGIFVPVVL